MHLWQLSIIFWATFFIWTCPQTPYVVEYQLLFCLENLFWPFRSELLISSFLHLRLLPILFWSTFFIWTCGHTPYATEYQLLFCRTNHFWPFRDGFSYCANNRLHFFGSLSRLAPYRFKHIFHARILTWTILSRISTFILPHKPFLTVSLKIIEN